MVREALSSAVPLVLSTPVVHWMALLNLTPVSARRMPGRATLEVDSHFHASGTVLSPCPQVVHRTFRNSHRTSAAWVAGNPLRPRCAHLRAHRLGHDPARASECPR